MISSMFRITSSNFLKIAMKKSIGMVFQIWRNSSNWGTTSKRSPWRISCSHSFTRKWRGLTIKVPQGTRLCRVRPLLTNFQRKVHTLLRCWRRSAHQSLQTLTDIKILVMRRASHHWRKVVSKQGLYNATKAEKLYLRGPVRRLSRKERILELKMIPTLLQMKAKALQHHKLPRPCRLKEMSGEAKVCPI